MILGVVSAKGGVGKTTLAANLATALARTRNVVALDLDPQKALRLHLGVPAGEIDGVFRATLQGRPWGAALFRGDGGPDVLPCGALNEGDRDALEIHLSGHPSWLTDGLSTLGLRSTDLVVVDSPPGPSLYQQQILRAAHFVVVVIHAAAASYATLPAMETVLETHCLRRTGFGGAVYVLNNVSASSALSRDIVRVVREGMGDRVAPLVIHQDEAVRESLAFDQPVLHYAPNGEASRDIELMARWLDQRLSSLPRRQPVRVA